MFAAAVAGFVDNDTEVGPLGFVQSEVESSVIVGGPPPEDGAAVGTGEDQSHELVESDVVEGRADDVVVVLA